MTWSTSSSWTRTASTDKFDIVVEARRVPSPRSGEYDYKKHGSKAPYHVYKPEGFEDYKTRAEVCTLVDRDRTRIRQLEREGRIPAPIRVKVGRHQVRLYSPEEVGKIVAFFDARPKPRRPKRNKSTLGG